jgi:hypothetical protein
MCQALESIIFSFWKSYKEGTIISIPVFQRSKQAQRMICPGSQQ